MIPVGLFNNDVEISFLTSVMSFIWNLSAVVPWLQPVMGTGLCSDVDALTTEGSTSMEESDLPVLGEEGSELTAFELRTLNPSLGLLVPGTLPSPVFVAVTSLFSTLFRRPFLFESIEGCLFKAEVSFTQAGGEFSVLVSDCSPASFRKRAARTSATSTANKLRKKNFKS